MKVLLSGASGLIGTALRERLRGNGHAVLRLVRDVTDHSPGAVAWDPVRRVAASSDLEGCDAVVHLAGENLANGRWTAARKRAFWDSRVLGTQFLAEVLGSLATPPKLFLCASAIGFYGQRGSEMLTEESGAGNAYLSELCQAWESAALRAGSAGIKVGCLRFGMILSNRGGALSRMLTPFRLGLGGMIGDGTQYWSWVSLRDAVGAICFLLDSNQTAGPFNVTSPQPVTNREFTRDLAAALHRPALLRAPGWAVRLALGEMADEMILASTRVLPTRLEALGFRFEDAALPQALARILAQGE